MWERALLFLGDNATALEVWAVLPHGPPAQGACAHWALITDIFSECWWGIKRASFMISVLKPLSLVRGGKLQTKNKICSLVTHHFPQL